MPDGTLDLRNVKAVAPANHEAEQAVLGLVLYDNDAIHALDGLSAEHFYEPAHGRLFQAISDAIGKGRRAEPIELAAKFATDAAINDLGGAVYLANLVDHAPPSSMAAHFGRIIAEHAQRRALITLAGDISSAARTGESEAHEVIGLAEAALLAMQVSSRSLEPEAAGAAAGRVLDWLDAPESEASGIVTGLGPLDDALGPLLPGNVVAMAGRTSMGKSAAAEVIAYNIARTGVGVIQISTEMSQDEMAQRHLTDIVQRRWGNRGPEYLDIRRRRINTDQRQMLSWAKAELDSVPLVMKKLGAPKLSEIRSVCRRQTAVWARQGIKLGAVILDHMGHVRLDQPSRDRYSDQTLISNSTKALADELGCVVFPLLQINRETEKRDEKRPTVSDIRDSGAWEQDADFAIGWFREAYYAQRQPEPKMGVPGSKEDAAWSEWDRARRSQIVEGIIMKARFGPPQTVRLWADVGRNAIRGHAPEGDLL